MQFKHRQHNTGIDNASAFIKKKEEKELVAKFNLFQIERRHS